MKTKIADNLSKLTKIPSKQILSLIEIPPSQNLGDYAFPCFSLAKIFKKSPNDIAQDLAKKLSADRNFEKVEANGPYINFFINRNILAKDVLKKILKEKDSYGSNKKGKGRKIVVDFSSPNIAKPFGIGHLRSTIIGNSLSNIAQYLGFKTARLNYLGDWGTPFGKIIFGYKKVIKRFLEKDSNVELVMWNDLTSIVILKEEPIIILIQDKETAESFITYFKELWEIAEI